MQDEKSNNQIKPERKSFTANLSWRAYDAIFEIQRHIRRETGKAVPRAQILDAIILEYAKKYENKISQ